MAKDRPQIVLRPRRKDKRVDVPGPEAGFSSRRQGKLTLVVPEGKSGRWGKAERPFRSLIFEDRRPAGAVLSCGLPKFFTSEQDPDSVEAANRALRSGEEVDVRVKLDGVLVIRSVIRGAVVMRTRQSFDGEHLGERFEAVAAADHPTLLDPALEPARSLLFEYVSPRHRIVIPYERERLHLIGAVDHASLRLATPADLTQLASDHGLDPAPKLPQPQSIGELKAALDEREDLEGAVVRWNEGQSLLKVKSAAWERSQRLRYELHPRKVHQLATKLDRSGRLTRERLLGACRVTDTDPLDVFYVEDLLERYRALGEDLERTLDELEGIVRAQEELPRKRFSREVAQPLGAPRSLALLALREGDRERARALLEAHWLKERFGDPTA